LLGCITNALAIYEISRDAVAFDFLSPKHDLEVLGQLQI
jgi:hypothetical protein